MYVLVYNGEISGTTDDPMGLPNGFQVFEIEKASLDELYFDGTKVAPRPPSPSPFSYWLKDHWVVPDTPVPVARTTDAELFSNLVALVAKDTTELVADCMLWLACKVEGDSLRADAIRDKLTSQLENMKNGTAN